MFLPLYASILWVCRSICLYNIVSSLSVSLYIYFYLSNPSTQIGIFMAKRSYMFLKLFQRASTKIFHSSISTAFATFRVEQKAVFCFFIPLRDAFSFPFPFPAICFRFFEPPFLDFRFRRKKHEKLASRGCSHSSCRRRRRQRRHRRRRWCWPANVLLKHSFNSKQKIVVSNVPPHFRLVLLNAL